MASQSGTLTVQETGETEIFVPWRPMIVKAMFVDGLSDAPPSSCSLQGDDQVFISVRSDEDSHYVAVRWRISKPRTISWIASN